jgi:hypothetical protein
MLTNYTSANPKSRFRNMEYFIYLIVKGASAAYIVYKAYRFLSGKRAAGFWRFMLPEIQAKETIVVPQTKPEPAAYSVVGKSQTAYLEEPPKVEVKTIGPAFSEDLPQVPAYEEVPDITAGDVDDSLNGNPDEEILSREERFILLDAEPDGEMASTGMTFEQISQALEVVRGKRTDGESRRTVARLLDGFRDTDLFNFLTAQAENEAIIEKLLKENLDAGGASFPENKDTGKQKRDIEDFDMEKYV